MYRTTFNKARNVYVQFIMETVVQIIDFCNPDYLTFLEHKYCKCKFSYTFTNYVLLQKMLLISISLLLGKLINFETKCLIALPDSPDYKVKICVFSELLITIL